MSDHQQDINLICEWMGWRKHTDGMFPGTFLWATPTVYEHGTFDPFENHSDCARVMDEVYERGFYYKGHSPFMDGEPFQGGLTPKGVTGWNGRPDYPGEGATETEAKMNAVLALIRASKEE